MGLGRRIEFQVFFKSYLLTGTVLTQSSIPVVLIFCLSEPHLPEIGPEYLSTLPVHLIVAILTFGGSAMVCEQPQLNCASYYSSSSACPFGYIDPACVAMWLHQLHLAQVEGSYWQVLTRYSINTHDESV